MLNGYFVIVDQFTVHEVIEEDQKIQFRPNFDDCEMFEGESDRPRPMGRVFPDNCQWSLTRMNHLCRKKTVIYLRLVFLVHMQLQS